MIHDETTTEIEIPVKKKPESNIVHIDFANGTKTAAPVQEAALPPHTYPAAHERHAHERPAVTHTESLEWFRDFDAETPWTLRLVAVILVLVLSLLIV